MCVGVQVSSQWVWIKRATNDEEEKDAIVELFVTLSKYRDNRLIRTMRRDICV